MSDKKKELLRSLKFLFFSVSAGVIQIGSFTVMEELEAPNRTDIPDVSDKPDVPYEDKKDLTIPIIIAVIVIVTLIGIGLVITIKKIKA